MASIQTETSRRTIGCLARLDPARGCPMAAAIADWIRSDMAPFAQSLGTTLLDLDNFDSFECRGRNRMVGGRLSEHGRANAIDIRALKLASGRSISLVDRTVSRSLRESVLHSACARFSTVLGPGSDWYHEDHIHLDLMERRGLVHAPTLRSELAAEVPYFAPLASGELGEQGVRLGQAN